MAKLTLSDIGNITTAAGTLNANNTLTETALENTLSRDGTAPNEMNADLDMNNNRIYNLPAPGGDLDPVRQIDIQGFEDDLDRAVLVAPGETGLVMPTNVSLRGKYLTIDGGGNIVGASPVPYAIVSTSITDSSATGRALLTAVDPAAAKATLGITAADITNSTATGRALLTAASAAAAKATLGVTAADITDGGTTGRLVLQAATDTIAADAIKVGWRNIRSAKTAAYTVVDGDHGSTLAFAGGALYQITISAVGFYRTNFMVELHNEDTFGKRVSISGQSPFILWPGESKTVYRDNANIVVKERESRYKLGNGVTVFYVDPINGYGTIPGDGVGVVDGQASGGGSTDFKFIQDAIDTIIKNIDCNNILPQIRVLGNVTGQQISMAFAGQPLGSCQIELIGHNSRHKWYANANNQTFVQARDNGIITVVNFDMDPNGYTGCVIFNPSQNGVIDYRNIQFRAAPGGYHCLVLEGGSLNCVDPNGSADYWIYGGATSHVRLTGTSKWNMGGVTIQCPTGGMAFTNGFINGGGCGTVNLGFNLFTGAGSGAGAVGQTYALDGNYVVYAGGTVFPGNAAGAATNGARYL